MRNTPRLLVLGTISAFAFLPHIVSAALITVSAPASWETDQTNAAGNEHAGSSTTTGNNAIFYDRVGERTASAPITGVSMDMPFQLPALSPGQAITSVTLEVSTVAQSSNKPVANADLYGLTGLTATPPGGTPPTNGATITGTQYYYSGSTTDTQSGVQLLQAAFLDPTNGTTAHNFTSTDLTSFFNDLYTNNPSAAGNYVTLRLSYDSTTFTPANRYEVYLSQGSNQPQPSAVTPVLAFTVTPEPASLGVLALGGMGLLARRRGN